MRTWHQFTKSEDLRWWRFFAHWFVLTILRIERLVHRAGLTQKWGFRTLEVYKKNKNWGSEDLAPIGARSSLFESKVYGCKVCVCAMKSGCDSTTLSLRRSRTTSYSCILQCTVYFILNHTVRKTALPNMASEITNNVELSVCKSQSRDRKRANASAMYSTNQISFLPPRGCEWFRSFWLAIWLHNVFGLDDIVMCHVTGFLNGWCVGLGIFDWLFWL